MSLTTDKNNPCLKKTKDDGQQACYLVLSEEERAKGFVRPVRTAYRHVGKEVEKGEVISLEEALKERGDTAKEIYTKEKGFAAYLKYPESESPSVGKFIKKDELDAINSGKERFGGCGTVTTMGLALSETYARSPSFYGATFCCGCGTHLPVGENGEFVWEGTNEKVGT